MLSSMDPQDLIDACKRHDEWLAALPPDERQRIEGERDESLKNLLQEMDEKFRRERIAMTPTQEDLNRSYDSWKYD